MHRRGRHGRIPGRDRPRPFHHLRRGDGHPQKGGGPRLRTPGDEHRRRREDLRHLQLQRQDLQRAPHVAAVQYAQHVPERLRGGSGPEELRRVRSLRGVLPCGRSEAGPETVHQARPADLSQAGTAGCGQVGSGQMDRGLPRQEQDQLLRDRYGALQDGLPGPYRRPGLPEEGRRRQVHRSAGAHQAGESVPGRLRPRVQPPLRGRLHPRHHRPAHRHRCGEEVHRGAGPERGDPFHPRGEYLFQRPGPLGGEDRRHRRRPGRPELRLLPRHHGLQADGVREERGARRHAPLRHPFL